MIQRQYSTWEERGCKLELFANLHPDLKSLIVVKPEVLALLAEPKPTLALEDMPSEALQILSGMTITVSTLPSAFMPSRDELLAQFNEQRPQSELTEGGRAYTKHCHRHVGFWGQAKGSAQTINSQALERLEFILANATWRNVFYLPGDRPVCEFRVELGYGARWAWENGTCTGFRGFLEPPQEDGHEVGWKH